MPNEKEDKKEEKEGYSRTNLAKELNDITFKNDQIKMVRDLQSENTKLKEIIGKKGGKNQSSVPKIQGLETLRPRLGMQFKKKGVDY